MPDMQQYINRHYDSWDYTDPKGNRSTRSTDSMYQTGEEGEYNVLDTEEYAQDNKDVEAVESDDLSKFREGFFSWMDEHLRKSTAETNKLVFDLIVDSEKGKPANFVDEFIEKTGLTASSLKVALSKLAKFMQEYISENEAELGDAYEIVNLVKGLNRKRKQVEEKVPAKKSSQEQDTHSPYFSYPDEQAKETIPAEKFASKDAPIKFGIAALRLPKEIRAAKTKTEQLQILRNAGLHKLAARFENK
jgi:hypothetical protein